MNKKFLSAILFGALMVSSTGTFVETNGRNGRITFCKTRKRLAGS